MHKLIIDCAADKLTKVPLTPEELLQREHEASLPKPIAIPTAEERIEALELAMLAMMG